MKKISLVSFLALFIGLSNVWAQLPVNAGTKKVTFLEKVDATGVSATQLYDLSKTWAKEQGYEITEDQAGKKIVCSGKHSLTYEGRKKGEKGEVLFSFSVFLKDGKFRVIATDFTHQGVAKAASGGKLEATSAECGKKEMTAKTWLTIKKATNRETKKKIGDLKRVILEFQKNPANSDDW